MTQASTDIERAVAELVAIGMIDRATPPAGVRDLIVAHARSLAGIEAYSQLETLSLIGCSLTDYAALGRLGGLRVLVIENCDLAEVSWVRLLKLHVAVFRRNRVRDARALVELSSLQSLDLTGNPLTAETRAVAEATRAGRLLLLDDVETTELNIRLADAATGVVAYRTADGLRACATGLELTDHPEAAHVLTTPEQLAAVVAGTTTARALLGLADEARPA